MTIVSKMEEQFANKIAVNFDPLEKYKSLSHVRLYEIKKL